MLAHYAIRALMYEAARQRGDDPDGLSYVHAVRVIRRDIITHGCRSPVDAESSPGRQVLDEILDERVVSSRNRRTPHGGKRKMKQLPPYDRGMHRPAR